MKTSYCTDAGGFVEAVRQAFETTEFYRENQEAAQVLGYGPELDYILYKDAKVLAYAHCADEFVTFNPFAAVPATTPVAGFGFSMDSDLFRHLEQGWTLAWMADPVHADAWREIAEDEIQYPDGVTAYLEYCRKSGVTAENLRAKYCYEGPDVLADSEN